MQERVWAALRVGRGHSLNEGSRFGENLLFRPVGFGASDFIARVQLKGPSQGGGVRGESASGNQALCGLGAIADLPVQGVAGNRNSGLSGSAQVPASVYDSWREGESAAPGAVVEGERSNCSRRKDGLNCRRMGNWTKFDSGGIEKPKTSISPCPLSIEAWQGVHAPPAGQCHGVRPARAVN